MTGKKMYSEVIAITPDIAKHFLETSKGNPRYRNKLVDKSRVSMYARDMRCGNWQLSPQGIVLDENGSLVDGHHRLSAVIASNITVDMYVTYNCPSSTVVFDRGMHRTTAQTLCSCGFDARLANNRLVALVKYSIFVDSGIWRSKNASDSEICEYIINKEDTLVLTQELCSKGSGLPMACASFMLAVFDAIVFGIPYDVLNTFTEIVSSGFSSKNEEFAAILARNVLQEYKGKREQYGTYQCAIYEQCIYDFYMKTPRIRKPYNPKLVFRGNIDCIREKV